MNSTKCIAALFDLDGVVLDTESQYTLFWNAQGRKYLPEIEEFGKVIKGQTLTQIFEKHFAHLPEKHALLAAELIAFQQTMRYDYIPGVVDFMRSLRAEGVKTAIVTSSDEDKMNIVRREHPELPSLVDAILTAEMFAHSKPHPDCFLLGARTFATVPENCVVFEDSFHGLEAGNRAGMKVVGLATTNPEEAIRDKASIVISDFTGFSVARMKSLII